VTHLWAAACEMACRRPFAASAQTGGAVKLATTTTTSCTWCGGTGATALARRTTHFERTVAGATLDGTTGSHATTIDGSDIRHTTRTLCCATGARFATARGFGRLPAAQLLLAR